MRIHFVFGIFLVAILQTAFADIPCRSGLKSDTYQLSLDKIRCRDLCPNVICQGRPAIMNTTIFAAIDKYQIDCRCLGQSDTGNPGSTNGSASTPATAGKCSFTENRNGSLRGGFEVVYGNSRGEIMETCTWLCRDGRRSDCSVTEWY